MVLLPFDLGVLSKKDHVIGARESLKLLVLYLTAGLLFGLWAGIFGTSWFTGIKMFLASTSSDDIRKSATLAG